MIRILQILAWVSALLLVWGLLLQLVLGYALGIDISLGQAYALAWALFISDNIRAIWNGASRDDRDGSKS